MRRTQRKIQRTVKRQKADLSIVGVYTKNDYENSYFGFKINLEGSYGIQTRGSY